MAEKRQRHEPEGGKAYREDDTVFDVTAWREDVDELLRAPFQTEVLFRGGDVSVQNPFPTDGDSVYAKDIDEANSDLGNFTGAKFSGSRVAGDKCKYHE